MQENFVQPVSPVPAKITIREVAQHAGVSLGTASRVLNGHSNINPTIVAKVQASIKALNYSPNLAAQSLKGDRTRTIGMIVPNIAAPAISGYVTAAQDLLMEAGYALFVASTASDPIRANAFLDMLAARRVDGLIASVEPESVARYLQTKPAGRSAPLVLLDRNDPDDADSVLIDHAGGLHAAVHYLAGLGHKKISLLTGSATVLPAASRIEGFERALQSAGLTVYPNYIRNDCFDPEAAFLEAKDLLSGPDRPTAIISGGINTLTGVLRATKTLKLSIPADVSVIGSSDSDLAQLATPPISVITWNSREMGQTVAQMILEQINQPGSPPRQVKFAAELVVRESCAPPR
jgi:LacI family transcriptional regulator